MFQASQKMIRLLRYKMFRRQESIYLGMMRRTKWGSKTLRWRWQSWDQEIKTGDHMLRPNRARVSPGKRKLSIVMFCQLIPFKVFPCSTVVRYVCIKSSSIFLTCAFTYNCPNLKEGTEGLFPLNTIQFLCVQLLNGVFTNYNNLTVMYKSLNYLKIVFF